MTPYEELRLLDGLKKTDKVDDWRENTISLINTFLDDKVFNWCFPDSSMKMAITEVLSKELGIKL